MIEAKLSTKNQIVIPREARQALKAKPGDRLLIVVRGDTVVLLNKPRKFSQAIRGMARMKYGKDHVQEERDSWS